MARIRAVIQVGLLVMVFVSGGCFGQEKKTDEAVAPFALTIKVWEDGSEWLEHVVWSHPHKWRIERTVNKDTSNFSVCDGETAWSYTVSEGKKTDIKRWNLKSVLKEYDEGHVYFALLTRGGAGLRPPIDPSHTRWKDSGLSPMITRYIKRTGEDKAGDTITERYEGKGGSKSVYLFGKDDGILRKQVFYKRDDNGEEKEWKTWTVEKIDADAKIDNTTFSVDLAEKEKAQDMTEDLKRELDTVWGQNSHKVDR